VSLRELSGEAAVWLAREVNTVLYERLLDACLTGGYVPNIVREALTYDEMLDAISSGLGAGFVKESTTRRMLQPGVVFRELEAAQLTIEIGVVYRPHKSSRRREALLRVLEDLSDARKYHRARSGRAECRSVSGPGWPSGLCGLQPRFLGIGFQFAAKLPHMFSEDCSQDRLTFRLRIQSMNTPTNVYGRNGDNLA
jgi:hypothetical protein